MADITSNLQDDGDSNGTDSNSDVIEEKAKPVDYASDVAHNKPINPPSKS